MGDTGTTRRASDVAEQRVLPRLVPEDQLVVHVLGGDVHEREVEGVLVGHDVLPGDLVDAVPDVLQEGPPRLAAPLLVGLLDHAPEVLERELRVHRHQAAGHDDRRVHLVAAPEAVLEAVGVGGQDLGQQALEEDLAEAPADLRRPEDLLEPGDVPADLLHAARRLAERAQLAVDLGHRPRGLLEALAHRLLGVLHERHAVLEAPVHLGRHLLELHRDGALELAEALPDLPAEAGHLLVHRRQGRVLAAVALVADARDLALEDLEPGVQAVVRRPPRAAGQDHEAPDHGAEDDQPGEREEGEEGRVGHRATSGGRPGGARRRGTRARRGGRGSPPLIRV